MPQFKSTRDYKIEKLAERIDKRAHDIGYPLSRERSELVAEIYVQDTPLSLQDVEKVPNEHLDWRIKERYEEDSNLRKWSEEDRKRRRAAGYRVENPKLPLIYIEVKGGPRVNEDSEGKYELQDTDDFSRASGPFNTQEKALKAAANVLAFHPDYHPDGLVLAHYDRPIAQIVPESFRERMSNPAQRFRDHYALGKAAATKLPKSMQTYPSSWEYRWKNKGRDYEEKLEKQGYKPGIVEHPFNEFMEGLRDELYKSATGVKQFAVYGFRGSGNYRDEAPVSPMVFDSRSKARKWIQENLTEDEIYRGGPEGRGFVVREYYGQDIDRQHIARLDEQGRLKNLSRESNPAEDAILWGLKKSNRSWELINDASENYLLGLAPYAWASGDYSELRITKDRKKPYDVAFDGSLIKHSKGRFVIDARLKQRGYIPSYVKQEANPAIESPDGPQRVYTDMGELRRDFPSFRIIGTRKQAYLSAEQAPGPAHVVGYRKQGEDGDIYLWGYAPGEYGEMRKSNPDIGSWWDSLSERKREQLLMQAGVNEQVAGFMASYSYGQAVKFSNGESFINRAYEMQQEQDSQSSPAFDYKRAQSIIASSQRLLQEALRKGLKTDSQNYYQAAGAIDLMGDILKEGSKDTVERLLSLKMYTIIPAIEVSGKKGRKSNPRGDSRFTRYRMIYSDAEIRKMTPERLVVQGSPTVLGNWPLTKVYADNFKSSSDAYKAQNHIYKIWMEEGRESNPAQKAKLKYMIRRKADGVQVEEVYTKLDTATTAARLSSYVNAGGVELFEFDGKRYKLMATFTNGNHEEPAMRESNPKSGAWEYAVRQTPHGGLVVDFNDGRLSNTARIEPPGSNKLQFDDGHLIPPRGIQKKILGLLLKKSKSNPSSVPYPEHTQGYFVRVLDSVEEPINQSPIKDYKEAERLMYETAQSRGEEMSLWSANDGPFGLGRMITRTFSRSKSNPKERYNVYSGFGGQLINSTPFSTFREAYDRAQREANRTGELMHVWSDTGGHFDKGKKLENVYPKQGTFRGSKSNPVIHAGLKSFVTKPDGKIVPVKNLGWILRNWKNIERMSWVSGTDNPMVDGVFQAYLTDGSVYNTAYSDKGVFEKFINRPVFKGLRINIDGQEKTVGEGGLFSSRSNPTSLDVSSLSLDEAYEELDKIRRWIVNDGSKYEGLDREQRSRRIGQLVQSGIRKDMEALAAKYPELKEVWGQYNNTPTAESAISQLFLLGADQYDFISPTRRESNPHVEVIPENQIPNIIGGMGNQYPVTDKGLREALSRAEQLNMAKDENDHTPKNEVFMIVETQGRDSYYLVGKRWKKRNPSTSPVQSVKSNPSLAPALASLSSLDPMSDPDHDSYDAASGVSEMFHGRPVEEDIVVKEKVFEHENFAQLGTLARLIFIAEPKSSRAKKTEEITLEFADPDQSAADVVRLCADPEARTLYFIGGDQSVDLEELGFTHPKKIKDLIILGTLVQVEYLSDKAFDKFQMINYYHQLGEETKKFPVLLYDTHNDTLKLAGGEYTIEDRGIVN